MGIPSGVFSFCRSLVQMGLHAHLRDDYGTLYICVLVNSNVLSYSDI